MPVRSTEQKSQLRDPPKDVRPADLDEVDRRILSSLHADARITNNALAEKVGSHRQRLMAAFGGW